MLLYLCNKPTKIPLLKYVYHFDIQRTVHRDIFL